MATQDKDFKVKNGLIVGDSTNLVNYTSSSPSDPFVGQLWIDSDEDSPLGDLSAYLTLVGASTTYLRQNSASAIYLTISSSSNFLPTSASSNYLRTDTASATYLPISASSNYLATGLVDSKGDLVTATADNTPARLAVGSNGDALVADSGATAGLRWQGVYNAGRNRIINGNFAVNQRGFTSVTSGFNFDRWQTSTNDGSMTVTCTPQTFTPGAAPVAGYEGTNFLRTVVANSSGGGIQTLQQRIEDVRTFAGQTVTLSFWAKAGSGTPKIGVNLFQDFGSGGSGGVNNISASQTITTSWARYSITMTLPSISGKTVGTGSYLNVAIYLSYVGYGTQNETIDFWGVQVEAGSVATRFEEEPYEATLRKCQRYYYRAETDSANVPFGLGQCHGTTTGVAIVPFPTTMRTQPTALEQTGTAGDYRVWTSTAGVQNLTAVPSFNSATRDLGAIGFTVASGLTAGNATGLLRTNTSAYLAWSAEL